MENEFTGENQSNQETSGQTIERLRNERNSLKKENQTLKVQKSNWKKKAESKPSQPEKETSKEKKGEQSDELDYGQKAFLKASGISGEEETALVKNFMDRTGDSLDVVIEDDIFTAKLKSLRDKQAAKAAVPQGGKSGSATDRDSVDYYLQTGETPPLDKVELRRKVVNARIAKENSGQSNFVPDEKQQEGSVFTNSGIEIK